MARILLEAALIVGLLGLFVYGTIRLLSRGDRDEQHPAVGEGEWRVAHYDVDKVTRVVLQKVSPAGGSVLDEHLVAAVSVDDSDYDEKFLEAMATARQRQALFEAEE